MSQLYSRVFIRILDSSIAEDYRLRHTFEDFLKLADYRTGIVDVTREALARRLNMPIDVLNEHIGRLEAPDPQSRDEDAGGRRLERLDDHRDWGWRIVNWGKYDAIRNKADGAIRVARHRDKVKEKKPPSGFKKPSIEEVKLVASKAGLPMLEAEKFFNYYESNGWRVGRNPMKSWTHALTNWKNNLQNYGKNNSKPNPRNVGVIVGKTDYGSEKPRAQREREAAEQQRMVEQVATDEDNPPRPEVGPGSPV